MKSMNQRKYNPLFEIYKMYSKTVKTKQKFKMIKNLKDHMDYNKN